MSIKGENYITVMGWMRNIPEIESSSELLAYAFIYGFSQVEGQYMTCKQSYLAMWLKMSREKCNKLLIRMENKGLIKKILLKSKGSIKQYQYCCILPDDSTCDERSHVHSLHVLPKVTRTSDQRSHVTSDQRSQLEKHININNNNIYNVRARNSAKNPDFFGTSLSENRIPKSKNQFDQFVQRDYDYRQLEIDIQNKGGD